MYGPGQTLVDTGRVDSSFLSIELTTVDPMTSLVPQ